MELVGRMLDGTISYTDRGALEPVPGVRIRQRLRRGFVADRLVRVQGR